jgi:dTDP-4-amino-4,6-dideoxygalactose transaminase
MKFVDLQIENELAVRDSSNDFSKIEESGKYLLGEFLNDFELRLSNDQGVKSAACVKNATDALYMTFKLLECEKRTLIVPAFGAYPTVIAAIQAGAKNIIAAPVDESLTLDLSNIDVPRDSIIVPVHLFGNRASSPSVLQAARDTDSVIIEDCAQSTGVEKMSESFAAIHSFYPTKPLGCRGDGGAIVSDNELFIEKCKKSRFYGLDNGEVKSWGFNSRMDEWQAAFLSRKVTYYRENNRVRQENAKKILSSGFESIKFSDDCVFHQLVTLWKDRNSIARELEKSGIPTMIHYPKMLHDMPWLHGKVNFIDCRRVSDHILSLPAGPHLSDDDVSSVSEAIYRLRDSSIRFEDVK